MGSVKKAIPSNPRKSPAKKDRGPARRRLQCPFYAKNPDIFRGFNSSCNGNGFETNARVVEHLKRAHGPIELSDGVVDADATAPPDLLQETAKDFDHEHFFGPFEPSGSVVKQEPTVPDSTKCSAAYETERVTQEQLDSIGKIPRSSNVEDKWEKICGVIFPGDEAVKQVYMPSTDRVREHAHHPPEWLIAEMRDAIGVSRQEIIMMLRNFLVFLDIISGRAPSLGMSMLSPPQTHWEQSSTGSDFLGGDSSMGGISSQASMTSYHRAQQVQPAMDPRCFENQYNIMGSSSSAPAICVQPVQIFQPMGSGDHMIDPPREDMENGQGVGAWSQDRANECYTDTIAGEVNMSDMGAEFLTDDGGYGCA